MSDHINLTTPLKILASYFALTVLMTWPTVWHLTDGIPGDGFDGWQNYWNLWWVRQALLVDGVSPFFTPYLDAPTGVSLLFHTLNIFNGLWTLPIQLNAGLTVAYNSVVLLSFVLAGYGGYLLALDTLLRLGFRRNLRGPAFISGLIFTMSPFHFAHLLGHMQVFSMIWPPFYVLWLLRTIWPHGRYQPFSISGRNIGLTALFLVLTSLVAWYHTLYLILLTGLTVLFVTFLRWRETAELNLRILSQPFLTASAIGLIFVVLLAPLLGPMVVNASQRPDLDTGLAQNIALSADLLAFIVPHEMHPIWGEWVTPLANSFTTSTSERMIFVGFVPLLLAMVAGIHYRKRPVVQIWLIVAFCFAVMALGPYLHINGEMVRLSGWAVPLPYLVLYHTVPFIDLTRSLSRYTLVVMLALGVLAAIGTHTFLRVRPTIGRTIPILIGGLICVEFLVIPYPISKTDTPAFFYQLAQDEADYTIAQLPMNWDRPHPLLHQTAHRKKLLTAYTSRANPFELSRRTPVFQQWRYLQADIIDLPFADIAPTIFYDVNLRYIVLDYWQMPPGPERTQTEYWLGQALPNAASIHDDGRLKVYQTPPKTETRAYLTLGQGWSEPSWSVEGQPRRKIDVQADLFLYHLPAEGTQLIFELVESAPIALAMDGQPFTALDSATQHRFNIPPTSAEVVKLRLQANQPVTVTRMTLNSFSE